MKVSVVVPVLNEVDCLPALFLQLSKLAEQGVEVVVVDGGSTDATVQQVRQAGFFAVVGDRGRARQMNLGAVHATGDVLLFLHADNRLPTDWLQAIQTRLGPKTRWGRFDVRISGRSAMLPVIATFMNWRSRWTGIATGDQAIFMTREAFKQAGGFPDQPLMEDIEMSRRLLGISRPACIASKTETSGRRWETRGVWTTIVLMWRLRWRYWRGCPPAELAKDYS